jgi:hypothetical protein
MNRDLKTVTDWVKEPESFSPPRVLEAAVRLSSPRRRSPRKEMAVGRMKPTSEQLDAETRRLKADALLRAGGFGELSGDPLTSAELCHLEGGNGTRRQRQWIGNVLIETHENHQGPGGLDKDPERWLPRVKAWCAKYHHPLPERWRRLEVKMRMREQHPSKETP